MPNRRGTTEGYIEILELAAGSPADTYLRGPDEPRSCVVCGRQLDDDVCPEHGRLHEDRGGWLWHRKEEPA